MFIENLYSFKKADLEDLKEIIEFGKKQAFLSYSQGYKQEDLNKYLEEEYSEDRFSEYILNEENQFIIIKSFSISKIIGYILITKCSLEINEVNKDRDLEIRKLYIEDNYRGIGLGSKLIQEALQKVSEKCKIEFNKKKRESNYIAPKLFVNVWIQNLTSQKFYEKHNFKFVTTNAIPVGSVIDFDNVYINNFEIEYK